MIGFAVLRSGSSGSFLPSAPDSDGAGDQVIFQQKAARDRAALFSGVLEYKALPSVDVGDSVEFSATLAGRDAGPNPLPPDVPEEAMSTREMAVGGVQGAYLSEPHGDVHVDPIGADRKLLASPRDRVEWRWNLIPRKPGQYQLNLVVETYQGNTENVLAHTDPPIRISMTVNKTFWYRAGEAKEWIIATGAVIAALGVIFGPLRRPLGTFISAHVGKGRRADKR
ncbi:hypothetical protein [Streptomyces sp. NPDC058084]|uniref:hypothetical protein n=1 Tax=Streptomyces sp. NPDC058084 TaxID=3346333 RepID=UPI0036E56637